MLKLKIGSYFIILFLLFLFVKVDLVSALKKVPIPTFEDIHERYNAITVSESGWRNLSDQDGILQALLWNGGGRKKIRKETYGLNYSKLMKRMAAHSTRIFPSDSKFLDLTTEQRIILSNKQTKHNKWTSELKLDCSEPKNWPEEYPSWKYHYSDRCKSVVRSTQLFLQGKIRSYCDGQPTTWGSEADAIRPNGPLEKGWLEISCNRINNCNEFNEKELLNSKVCARNRFFNFLIIIKKGEKRK